VDFLQTADDGQDLLPGGVLPRHEALVGWTFDELHDYARLRFFKMRSLIFSLYVRNNDHLVDSDEALAHMSGQS